MSVVRRHIGEGAVSPNKLDSAVKGGSFGDKGAYFRYVADRDPAPFVRDGDGFTIPPAATTDGTTVQCVFPGLFGGLAFITYVGDATLFSPRLVDQAKGLQIDFDNAAEGAQYDLGDAISGKGAFAVDSDGVAPYFVRAKLKLADVSDMITCAVGFRGAEAAAAYSNYSDIAVLDVIGGDVKVVTENAGGGQVITDTGVNVVDGGVVELKVVFFDGIFRFFVNGVEYPPQTAAEAAITLFPFIFISKTAGTGFVYLQELEAGPLSAVDDHFFEVYS
jgi:hypothetical protein